MDSLSEQHGTYFAEPTTFNMKAEKDGVHKFACPETSIEGRLIITPNTEVRAPANEGLWALKKKAFLPAQSKIFFHPSGHF